MDESNVNGPFLWQNWQCACAVSRDRVVGGHPKPHICDHRYQFAYSLYNCYWATMTIKGSLQGASPCKVFIRRQFSWCHQIGLGSKGGLSAKFYFVVS